MSTLTEFLLARVAEDESRARGRSRLRPEFQGRRVSQSGLDLDWLTIDGEDMHWGDVSEPVPPEPRALAECEAKRRIVERYEFERNRRDAYRSPRSRELEDEQATQDRRTQEARSAVAEDVVKLLVLPYAGHEDYDQAWRPE